MSLCSFPILLPSSVSDGAGQKLFCCPLNCPRGSFSVSPLPLFFLFNRPRVRWSVAEIILLPVELSAWLFFLSLIFFSRIARHLLRSKNGLPTKIVLPMSLRFKLLSNDYRSSGYYLQAVLSYEKRIVGAWAITLGLLQWRV